MAKKTRNSGLGRGLDSLIPNIAEENEVEEGISLEDLMKNADDDKEETADETETTEKESSEDKDDEVTIENRDSEVKAEEESTDKTTSEEKNETEKDETSHEDPETFTNVLGNDDEVVEEKSQTAKVDYKEELSTKTVDKRRENSFQEKPSKIEEEDPIKNILDDENIPNIEDSLDINDNESFLSKEDEKNISEIIETVEKNPRITLWSAKSAAVLRYLRKTQPEFSISKEASRLIDEAIAEEYPEIWTLFNHL